MAMAHEGMLPSFFGKIHPKYRTPYVSIIIFALISLALALQSGLLQNLSLSAVSRLLLYGGVCLSLPVFRSRESRASRRRCGASIVSRESGRYSRMIGVVLSLLLATRMGRAMRSRWPSSLDWPLCTGSRAPRRGNQHTKSPGSTTREVTCGTLSQLPSC
jgi:amino acid transporter